MIDLEIWVSQDSGKWLLAGLLLAAWLALVLCKARQPAKQAGDPAAALVVHASQTGHAADLAEQARARIAASGVECVAIEANRLTAQHLAGAQELFFIVSTTGDGDPPDNARHFEQRLMAQGLDLSGKSALVLGLGDRRYPDFCGYGHRVADWAAACGAQLRAPLVEVDDLSPGDLALWESRLSASGLAAGPIPTANLYMPWRIAAREQVAGPARDEAGILRSDGLYRITLQPEEGNRPQWEVGDLFELQTPDGHLRDYSIASEPGADELVLFVRRVVDDGQLGRGSGLLSEAEMGAFSIRGRIRQHPSFHVATGKGPLLAIGAGSGWAGLRPHLIAATQQGQSCRLIFGERDPEDCAQLLAEMQLWDQQGALDVLSLCFSRSEATSPSYVQNLLERDGGQLADYLGSSGRIVICGRMEMGERCLAALSAILGQEWMEAAREDGRLRRDLY